MLMESVTRSFAVALLMVSAQVVYAQTGGDAWVVRNFEVEGAQRIAVGTVSYTHLTLPTIYSV